MVRTRLLTEIQIEDMSAAALEGLELDQGSIHAPAVFRDEPSYAWAYRRSVVVLRSRRAV